MIEEPGVEGKRRMRREKKKKRQKRPNRPEKYVVEDEEADYAEKIV